MKATTISILLAMAAMPCIGGCNPARADRIGASATATAERSVSFDDIAPKGLVLEQCWDAMGMDSRERVYIGFTAKRPDGREDFAVFRYAPDSGDRRFLGTFMNASQAAGNLRPAEEIPKGHTRMLEIDGKMYMGSQGFHDLKGPIDTLPMYRGAHLYAYDPDREKLEDVGGALPGGVVIKHQGIVALSRMPGSDLLVGLAHPSSDIVLFDTKRNRVREIVPGIPWRLGNPLSREIVVTRNGKVFTYRGTEDPAHRDEAHPIWAFDLATGEMAPTTYTATGGFWNGQTWTRDGRSIYLSTVNGELYRLDTGTDAFTYLGHFLSKQDYDAGARVDYLYGITLSADEKRIYGVPRLNSSTGSPLYSYEIETRQVTFVKKLEPAIYTGSQMHDSRGNIYFGRFGDGRAWEGNARLEIVHPSPD